MNDPLPAETPEQLIAEMRLCHWLRSCPGCKERLDSLAARLGEYKRLADSAFGKAEQYREAAVLAEQLQQAAEAEAEALALVLQKIADAEHQFHPVAGYIYPDKIEKWAREALQERQ